jgi:hypothetical protein
MAEGTWHITYQHQQHVTYCQAGSHNHVAIDGSLKLSAKLPAARWHAHAQCFLARCPGCYVAVAGNLRVPRSAALCQMIGVRSRHYSHCEFALLWLTLHRTANHLQHGQPERKKEKKKWRTSLSSKAMVPRAGAGGECTWLPTMCIVSMSYHSANSDLLQEC